MCAQQPPPIPSGGVAKQKAPTLDASVHVKRRGALTFDEFTPDMQVLQATNSTSTLKGARTLIQDGDYLIGAIILLNAADSKNAVKSLLPKTRTRSL